MPSNEATAAEEIYRFLRNHRLEKLAPWRAGWKCHTFNCFQSNERWVHCLPATILAWRPIIPHTEKPLFDSRSQDACTYYAKRFAPMWESNTIDFHTFDPMRFVYISARPTGQCFSSNKMAQAKAVWNILPCCGWHVCISDVSNIIIILIIVWFYGCKQFDFI